ncbi:unnamed protein product [Effrenium voratum]|uniref:Uncharacterized protein n=1 Tax=Effrenium voratum TaxID=2562239 RepID=A0AA36JAS7_9DINO|nr:unnamed protein product [Effrenium voratum]
MDDLDFDLLQAKVLGAESSRLIAQGRTGLPPAGWSPAAASARLLGDGAGLPGAGGSGGAGGRERFGQLNGRLAFLLDRLEARVLRSGPPPKKAQQSAPVLHLYDEDPIELAPRGAQTESEGPSVPFRLTEAKLCREPIGDCHYFGRLNLKVTNVATTTVALFAS